MVSSKRVTAADLELESASGDTTKPNLREARENLEREMVQHALRNNGGRITGAAAALGISRPTLYELMEKLGVQRE
jgi:two-component system NtrC family response regulator